MLSRAFIIINDICIQSAPQTDVTTTKSEDVDEAPPPSRKKSDKDAITEELLRQKEQLEHERVCNSMLLV